MNETGGERGQIEGSQKQNASHPPTPWSRTKCSGGDARGWLVLQAYHVQLAKHETPCGIASVNGYGLVILFLEGVQGNGK